LGERLNGIQEVSGSIPLSSTTSPSQVISSRSGVLVAAMVKKNHSASPRFSLPLKEDTMRILASVICLIASPAFAQAQGVSVQSAWARATTASQTVGGVFLTLVDGGAPDRLLSASSPIAASLELHETVREGDVMKMRPVPALPLASGQTVELKPGGYHLMAMGLKQPLKVGATFPVTLNFENSGPVTVTATVGKAGASGPMMDHGAMHKMP
jgi:copper(I)-binding protein